MSRILKEILLILTIIQEINCDVKALTNFESKEQFTYCIKEISKKFKKSYNTIVLVNENDNTDNDVTNTIINILMDNKIPLIKTSKLNEVQKYGKVLVLRYYNDCETLLINSAINNEFNNLIIVDKTVNDSCLEIIKEILFSIKTSDVTFLIKIPKTSEYNFVWVTPEIDEKTCEKSNVTSALMINPCNNGAVRNTNKIDIFSKKISVNLKKCNFNVGMASLAPYSIIENKDLLKPLDSLTKAYGSDFEIMKIVAKVFNASLKLYYIYRSEENPYLNKEIIENLLNGTLDACAGGLYRIYGDSVAYSGIYSRQSVIWVYATERSRRSWRSLFSKISGLYIFFIFYITYAVIWNVIRKFDNHNVSIPNTLFYGLGALLGASSLPDSRSFKQKILNTTFLFMCLYLSAFISTQMYYYLTIIEPPQNLKTFEDLKSSDRTPYLVKRLKYFIHDYKYEAFANTSLDCEEFKDCQDIILKNKGSTIVIDGFLPVLQSSTAVDDEARVMSVGEDIIFVYHEMLMRKDYPLVTKFKEIIQRLFEAGICEKLYNEAIGITIVDRAKIANKNIMSNSYSCTVGCPITLLEVAGAFYIWIIGCVIAGCVFIVEIFIKRLKNVVAARN